MKKMKRVFPTQLRVVDERTQLNAGEESKKGYYDAESKNAVLVGVRETNVIYISSPGNWYRHYIFKILKIPTTLFKNPEDADDAEDDEKTDLVENDKYDIWRILAQLIKTECGRKVIHKPGQNYLTICGMNKDMAKQFYYLTKHMLVKIGVQFKLTYSLFSPFGDATAPDVRVKPKRKRQKKINMIQPPRQNAWTVVTSPYGAPPPV
jgi:hypothetical protein